MEQLTYKATTHRPFEWLTSPTSLHPFLNQALNFGSTVDEWQQKLPPQDKKRALHVGCGSSAVGEYLISQKELGVSIVLNVDKDEEVINVMRERWSHKTQQCCQAMDPNSMEFQSTDFCTDRIDAESGSFDLVVDKSTLDCTLCSDESTARLLMEVYRLLKPQSGVYLLISFHCDDLLLPLLRDLPGCGWKIEHHQMIRCLEDLDESVAHSERPPTPMPDSDDTKARLNVFLCRKGSTKIGEDLLNFIDVSDHVHRTNNEWFRKKNPLLTHKRHSELVNLFGSRQLSLVEAYDALFTDTEREHYGYDLFLSDWSFFVSTSANLSRETELIGLSTAVAFLDEMQ